MSENVTCEDRSTAPFTVTTRRHLDCVQRPITYYPTASCSRIACQSYTVILTASFAACCVSSIFEPWPSWAPFQPWRSVPYIYIHRPMDYLSVPLTGLSNPQVTRLGQYFLMTFAANVLLTKPHFPQALGHWQYIRPYPDTAGIDWHQTPSCYDLSPALTTTVR